MERVEPLTNGFGHWVPKRFDDSVELFPPALLPRGLAHLPKTLNNILLALGKGGQLVLTRLSLLDNTIKASLDAANNPIPVAWELAARPIFLASYRLDCLLGDCCKTEGIIWSGGLSMSDGGFSGGCARAGDSAGRPRVLD